MQTFQATNIFGVVTIGWMYDYHKFWIHDGMGGRARNSNFDKLTGYLLDLKKSDNRNFDHAVSGFARALLKDIKSLNFLAETEEAIVCAVPSSKVGKVAPGLVNIAKILERDNGRIKSGMKTLIRTTEIDKLADGGNRDITVHRRSIDIGERVRKDRTYILIDDITTTGNSLAACAEILARNGARRILPIALGKTL